MLEINAAFGQEGQNLGLVGRTGENASRRIVFDCEAVLGEFPGAGIVCALRRACDAEAYAKELTAEGKKRLLTLSAADVAAPGSLMIELRAVEADAIRKSAVYVGRIERGLSGQGDAPGNPVADTINSLEARAKEASAAASAAQAVANEVQAKLEAGDFKGDPGKDGAPGKDGSDANVTAENIQSALGYAPVTPSALAAKQDALTDADRQSITKTGMTTGAAWTENEQKAARDRMGVDKEYELIEEITLTENVTQIIRTDEPDGTAYAFERVVIKINRTNTGEGGVYVYSGTTVLGWSYLSGSGQYFACETFSLHGYWQNYRYSASSGHIDYNSIAPSGDSRFLKIKKVAGQYVSKIQIKLNNAELGIGTKISIYGVRA